MFLSIALSSGEKPVSPGAPASSTTLRSERIDPVFQPNTARRMRANQRSLASRDSFAAGTGTGRFRISAGVSAVSLVFGASLSAMEFASARSAYGSGTPSRARIRRSRRSIASACPCDS